MITVIIKKRIKAIIMGTEMESIIRAAIIVKWGMAVFRQRQESRCPFILARIGFTGQKEAALCLAQVVYFWNWGR